MIVSSLPFDAHCGHMVTAKRAERQSAQMSKITNVPGLAQDALKLYPYGNSGRQRLSFTGVFQCIYEGRSKSSRPDLVLFRIKLNSICFL